uniref:Uncharacterized protein n=1 Tax=Siphoviridae sp. ctqPo10 TaxID=2827948 RepID=A0A8S5SVB5_9CAUD|nr:MAG TPA: hypothetical protein [Siphoviridae sp. ctqPo10]DAI19739.1 MAG TPA: hypothetical protein [Caudoviricetes sp.]
MTQCQILEKSIIIRDFKIHNFPKILILWEDYTPRFRL